MAKILFLNHSAKHCGVYQYGLRLYTILKTTPDIQYIYKEINTLQEYNTVLVTDLFDAIIYNYHASTMRWLTSNTIQTRVINIGIPHESPASLFHIICEIDPTQKNRSNYYVLPRPIFENCTYDITTSSSTIKQFITNYTDTDIPIFGSFGFGFRNKGFDKIIRLVNEQYDNAIIKLIITHPTFYADPNEAFRIGTECANIPVKSGIKVLITHEFFEENEILSFLHSNTMNIFLYDTMNGRSISSVIDYALSVKKPIGISDSSMFRHIYSDKLCLYKTPIKDCLNNTAELEKALLENSNSNLLTVFSKLIKDNVK